jgi:hypothetical protein
MFTTALMSTQQSEWGPDAKQWRPSRWLTPEGAFNRSAGTNIPFGLGQRSCFGQRLAVSRIRALKLVTSIELCVAILQILQIKMFVASMSRAFFFKPVPHKVDVWSAVELVTRQPNVCYVSLERWD